MFTDEINKKERRINQMIRDKNEMIENRDKLIEKQRIQLDRIKAVSNINYVTTDMLQGKIKSILSNNDKSQFVR